jgi:hypothetical protein
MTESVWKTLPPIVAAAGATAAAMYPVDVVRTLKMASASVIIFVWKKYNGLAYKLTIPLKGQSLPTAALVSNFVKVHGVKGLFKQGVAPELVRSQYQSKTTSLSF